VHTTYRLPVNSRDEGGPDLQPDLGARIEVCVFGDGDEDRHDEEADA
jgi:hypothetical protein